jgi:hypothetical protein
MVVAGCAGIRALMKQHPESRFTIFSPVQWLECMQRELPGAEVQSDEV